MSKPITIFWYVLDGLITSIKRRKEEFFFVHASTFAVLMTYGVWADIVADAAPELSDDKRVIVDRIFVNYVKCSDPNETMLWIASLSSHWNKLRKRHLHTIDRKTVERLHKKRLASSSQVVEDASTPNSPIQSKSSMDSSFNASGNDSIFVSLKVIHEIIEAKHASGKPPSSSS